MTIQQKIKRLISGLLVLGGSMFFVSCLTSKDLMYLQNATDNKEFRGVPADSLQHVLQPGDILYVSIKSMNPDVNKLYNPESSMEEGGGSSTNQKFSSPSGGYLYGYELDVKGNIDLPMLGKINVIGCNPIQAQAIVQKKADEFLKDAIVKVKLINFRVTVIGEVRGPGVYYIYNNSISVLEALAMANGNTDFSSIRDVTVVRNQGKTSKSYHVDLTSTSCYTSEAFYLHPNDFVVVPPGRNKNLQLNGQVISLFFSSISLLMAVTAFMRN